MRDARLSKLPSPAFRFSIVWRSSPSPISPFSVPPCRLRPRAIELSAPPVQPSPPGFLPISQVLRPQPLLMSRTPVQRFSQKNHPANRLYVTCSDAPPPHPAQFRRPPCCLGDPALPPLDQSHHSGRFWFLRYSANAPRKRPQPRSLSNARAGSMHILTHSQIPLPTVTISDLYAR